MSKSYGKDKLRNFGKSPTKKLMDSVNYYYCGLKLTGKFNGRATFFKNFATSQ
jgi:hypothetical protein